MKTPDTDLYLSFRRWVLQPEALPKPSGDSMQGALTMIEDALWLAYQQGYKEGLANGLTAAKDANEG